MSLQFDTFDTVEDRKELVILFQKLGAGLPDAQARQMRASWLESLITESTSYRSPTVDPVSCSPVGAYHLFIQIVGVLGVSIREAAIKLSRHVSEA